jgi:hypothetical protein
MYVTILNFESGKIDVLEIPMSNAGDSAELYIEETLNYSLSNCDWMMTAEKPELNFLN